MTVGSDLGFDSACYRHNVAALVRVPLRTLEQADARLSGNSSQAAAEPRYLYLLCKRADHDAWQCPQGGLEHTDVTPALGMLRELDEELGVLPEKVRIVYESKCWRRYAFKFPRAGDEARPERKGQQQKWFLCEIDSLDVCDLSRSQGEFHELSLFSGRDMVGKYAAWKAGPFLDFCRELGLLAPCDQRFIEETVT